MKLTTECSFILESSASSLPGGSCHRPSCQTPVLFNEQQQSLRQCYFLLT